MRESDRFAKCLLRNEAYFGPVLAARNICEKFEGPIRILEIGSWAGASSVTWVKAFIELGRPVTIDCVDQWEPYFELSRETDAHYRRMNEAAASEDIYALFLHNLRAEGIDDRVNILRGSSKKILPDLKAKAYHLIYIDGSHLYPDVLSDIGQAKRLILNRGIICGDDLEIQADEMPAHELARAVESRLDYTSVGSDPRSFHPGVAAAVAEELGVVSAWEGYWAISWERGKAKKIVLDLAKVNLPAHIQHAVDQGAFLRLIEADDKFRIVEASDRYIAVAIHLDPQKTCDAMSFDFDVPPVIFVADSLIDLKEKLTVVQNASMQTPPGNSHDDSPVLIRTFEDFNLISYKGQIIGIHLSSGPVDVHEGIPSLLDRLGPERIVIGANEDSVLVGIALRKKLGYSEARQAEGVEVLRQRINAAEEALKRDVAAAAAHHAESIEPLGKSVAKAEAALKLGVEQSEARQAESVEVLRQQIDKCARILDGMTQSAVGRLLFPKNKKESG
jgi:Methyltransferase domain